MTFFDDLSGYTYYDASPEGPSARNVGWLDAAHTFPTEQAPEHLLDTLWEYCSIIVVPTRGVHNCELCASPSNTFIRHGARRLLGTGEIRVFDANGDAFAAPNLIYHYVLEHHYRPPSEFLRALENGPRPGTDEYKRLLERSGVPWRAITPLVDEPKQFRFVQAENGVETEEKKQ